jgi:hypothetical protein
MSLFEVKLHDNGWGVFAVNPNNPDDTELAIFSFDRRYAEMRAAALNRITEIEPPRTRFKIEVAVFQSRKIRLED